MIVRRSEAWERFAAAALAEHIRDDIENHYDELSNEVLAKVACDQADAMIRERDRRDAEDARARGVPELPPPPG